MTQSSNELLTGGSRKASARSKHEPSMMINQNAIINAPASPKMSPNSPSHKAQKALHRNARTSTCMKAETILRFYLCFFRVILSAVSCLREESSALPPALQQLYADLQQSVKSHICRTKSVFLISTAIQSMQSQKLACRFRTILGHVTSCSTSSFQPRA